MTLPSGFTSLPFSAARGIPQTVPFAVGAHSLRVTLAASATDLRALLQVGATTQIIDAVSAGHRRGTSVPLDAADRFRNPAPMTLAPEVIRPIIMVRDGDALVGARPVSTSRYLSFGRNASSPLVVELFVDALILNAGAFTQPGDVGGQISVGVRAALKGITPPVAPLISPDLTFQDAGGELSWALL